MKREHIFLIFILFLTFFSIYLLYQILSPFLHIVDDPMTVDEGRAFLHEIGL